MMAPHASHASHATALPKPLRTQLKNTVRTARDIAEKAAYAALVQLAAGEAQDRGKDVESAPWFEAFMAFKGERFNDHHSTLAQMKAARAKV